MCLRDGVSVGGWWSISYRLAISVVVYEEQ